jgi:hypothetical protein
VNEFIDRAESALDGSGHHSPHRTQRGRVPARVRNRSSGRYNRRQGVYCPDSADVTVIAYRRWVSRMRPARRHGCLRETTNTSGTWMRGRDCVGRPHPLSTADGPPSAIPTAAQSARTGSSGRVKTAPRAIFRQLPWRSSVRIRSRPIPNPAAGAGTRTRANSVGT